MVLLSIFSESWIMHCGFVESVHDFAVQGGAYCILLGISCWISISGLPFGSTIPAPPSTQDLDCDGERGQTNRMGNNTSLLELPTEFGTQPLGKPMLQDQRKIWLVNILLPYDCMQVQAS